MEKIGGVVDENVEAAEFFIGVGEELVDVGFFGEVGGEAYGAAAEVGDFALLLPGLPGLSDGNGQLHQRLRGRDAARWHVPGV